MKKLKITKGRFLDWYYDSGQDTEIRELKEDLANLVIKRLYDKSGVAVVTVEEIFNDCNTDAIRMSFTEGADLDDDTELSDIGSYELTLID